MKHKTKIKLCKVSEMIDGTVRLQSQLALGMDYVDFIIEKGVLKNYRHGDKGFGFYEYKEPYEIVESIKDMITQEL